MFVSVKVKRLSLFEFFLSKTAQASHSITILFKLFINSDWVQGYFNVKGNSHNNYDMNAEILIT